MKPLSKVTDRGFFKGRRKKLSSRKIIKPVEKE